MTSDFAIVPVRRVLVIYNPRSGTLLRAVEGDVADLLSEMFARHGIAAELRAFDAVALKGWIAEAESDGMDAVVACGGDGSILAVVTALGDRKLPLGVLRGGTMNVFARDLGLPEALEEAVAVIAAGCVRAIDVGEVNGHVFVSHSSIGLMPHLARKREGWRDLPGWLRWPRTFFGLLWMLWRFPRLHMHIDDGRAPRKVVTRAIAISNNPLETTHGPIPPRASVDAGVLGIHVAEDASRWTLFRVAARILAGDWKEDQALDVSQASTVVLARARPGPLSVMNDGEAILLESPLHYSIRPRALRVIVPEVPAVDPTQLADATAEVRTFPPELAAVPA